MKVLVVDDSMIMRNKISEVIRQSGLSKVEIVGVANNGNKALQLVKQTEPDLITMDITMPEMDGLACIKAIRALTKHPRILVITALSHKATGLEALKNGANGFLLKPFSDEKLTQAIAKLYPQEGMSNA